MAADGGVGEPVLVRFDSTGVIRLAESGFEDVPDFAGTPELPVPVPLPDDDVTSGATWAVDFRLSADMIPADLALAFVWYSLSRFAQRLRLNLTLTVING